MQKIIFDCDNTVGIEGYPMDDALAFLYLLGNRGRAQVLAFCCTFGNGTAQQVYESSRLLLEETGLRVKNVRYFGSQPWGCAGNLTLGYWAELDGDDAVTLEERELAEARWFDRTEVPVMDDNTSLTSAMVRAFAEGKEREYLEG